MGVGIGCALADGQARMEIIWDWVKVLLHFDAFPNTKPFSKKKNSLSSFLITRFYVAKATPRFLFVLD